MSPLELALEKIGLSGKEIAVYMASLQLGPASVRALAEQAGIGRIGKNGCVITKDFGSWIFLAEIITTVNLTMGASPKPSVDRWSDNAQKSGNVCGNCTK